MEQASFVWTLLYFAGMALVFIGERLFGVGPGRWLTLVGLLGVSAALGVRVMRVPRLAPDRRGVERLLAQLYLVGLVAVALYVVQSDLATLIWNKPIERDWPRLATVIATLWPALWLLAALPIATVEFSYAAVARAPKLELARVRDAALSGVGIACALVFAFAFTYVASERDKKVDLSYFRTARPGESTRKLVAVLDQPVQVALFFPPANEVREEVASYFDELKKESKLIEVQSYDHDVDLSKARELGASGNGIVVLRRAGHREQVSFGLELEAARSQLRNLDRDVQQRLLKIARPARTAYFVVGHGERGFEAANETDKRPTIRSLRDLLQQQSYTVRTLGTGEGLAQDVPADATVVALIGPTKPLLSEEMQSLVRYFERGGRLFLALDPDAKLDLHELLQPLGVKLGDAFLANDQTYVRRSNQPSDHINIGTFQYSSHPSVTALGRYGARAPMILFGAGAFEELKDKSKDLDITTTVRALPSTFLDANGNFTFDPPGEVRKPWSLALAITHKPLPTPPPAPAAKPDDKAKDPKAADAKAADAKAADAKAADAKAADAKAADAKAADAKAKDPKAAKPGDKPAEGGRAIALADSDLVDDELLGAQGNPLFVVDGVKWLAGDDAITGEVSNENDVPVVHSKKDDQVWFYGSVFLAPALVLAIGWLATRRRGAVRVRKEKA